MMVEMILKYLALLVKLPMTTIKRLLKLLSSSGLYETQKKIELYSPSFFLGAKVYF